MSFKISEVCDINSFNLSKNDNLNAINYLDTANLNVGTVDELQYMEVGKDKIPSRAKRIVRKNDILISTVRPNQKHYGIIKNVAKNMVASTGFAVLTPKEDKVDPGYIYNYLIQDHITTYLHSIAESSTSTYPSIKPSVIGDLEVDLPPLEEQKAIAHILSTLDDKIEVNNQINKTLENMAQAIFKQWFVDFEFPNEDGEPYKSSGGEMVESELGMIPKGWGVGEISDVVEFLGGFSFMSKDYLETGKYKVITIKNVLDGKFDSSSVKYLDIIPEKVKDVQKLEKGDILMSLTGNVARVCIVSENDCLLNQRVAKIQEKSRFSRGYIYVLFRSQLVKEILLAIAKGTAQLNLSPVEAQKMKIIIPCDKVIDKISVIYDSLFNLLLQSTDEIKLLEKFRDSLLPKLMSGEIRVPMDEEGDAS